MSKFLTSIFSNIYLASMLSTGSLSYLNEIPNSNLLSENAILIDDFRVNEVINFDVFFVLRADRNFKIVIKTKDVFLYDNADKWFNSEYNTNQEKPKNVFRRIGVMKKKYLDCYNGHEFSIHITKKKEMLEIVLLSR